LRGPSNNPNPALRGPVSALKNTEKPLQEISRKRKPLPVFGIFSEFSTDIHISPLHGARNSSS